MNSSNQTVVSSFISFLKQQNYSEENSESIEIAIQCLMETFGLDELKIKSLTVPDLPNLLSSKPTANNNTASPNKAEAETFKSQGNAFIAENKPEKAVESYNRAIELDATNAIYFSNRAAAYSMLGEHFNALEDAKQSCSLNPSYAKAFNRLGKTHMALGEPEEAIVAFERALQLEPNDTSIKTSLDAAKRAANGEEIEVSNTTKAPSNSSAKPSPQMPNMGGLDFASIMNNPQFMSMAQQMMQSGGLNDMLKDPKTKEMMNGLMSDPEMLKKFTGGK